MADESQYSSDTYSNKRKYEEPTAPPPSTRRPTGFSSGPIPSASVDPTAPTGLPPSSYNSVPPPMDEIQIAKQKAQEIAARLLNSADAKRPRVDNGASYDYGDNKGFSSYPSEGKQMSGTVPSSIPVSYGSFQGTTKKIDIPNMRVGVIIGKGGETIKYLQLQSGAKIQVTRDMDADPNCATRTVDLTGTPDQISKAEQLITDVLQEAEAGNTAGSGGGGGRRMGGQAGADQFVMKIPNNKVGLIIGKGGETIKSMQAKTGARIQVIPLHLPPGDPTPERTLQIDGITEQIEHAKQLVNEIISGENRMRNSAMGGGYPQQGGYQARPPSSWAPPGGPPAQPGYGGYMQPGAYPGPPQYGQSPYGSYPQQTSAGYYDQSSVPPSQQSAQGEYDYYGQQQSQQPSSGGSSAPPTDTTGYNYYQHASGYGQAGQGYQQDGYGAYNASQQSGYGQAAGYDQQGGYGSTTNPSQEEDASQAAPPSSAQSGQAGYGTTGQQPPAQGSTGQAGYGAPPTSQAGYSSQPAAAYNSGYGAPPPASKPPKKKHKNRARKMSVFLCFLVLLPLILIFLNVLKPSKYKLPPGPKKLPIIGNLHQRRTLHPRNRRNLAEMYGPVALLQYGFVPVVAISSKEAAEEVLKINDLECCSRPEAAGMRATFYNFKDIGMAPFGDEWSLMRKLSVVELFSVKKLQSFKYIIEEENNLCVKKLSEFATRQSPVNLERAIFTLVGNIVCRIGYGINLYECDFFEADRVVDLVLKAEAVIRETVFSDFFPGRIGRFIDCISGQNRRLKNNFSVVDTFFQNVLNEHLKPGRESSTIVDLMIDMKKKQENDGDALKFTTDHLKGMISDIFVAGIGGVAGITLWGMTELIRNPRVMKKVQDEIRTTLGDKKERIKEEDLNQLHYFKLVVKETLRLHPTTPLLLPRQTMSHIKIQGYDVPAKTQILVNVYAMGRDPKLWENADEFNPDRFLDSSVDFKGKNYEFIPFGSGRRICPGMTMGTILVEMALLNLLYFFDWGLAKQEEAKEIINGEENFLAFFQVLHH